MRDNYHFYGAPVAMIMHLPTDAVAGDIIRAHLDLGPDRLIVYSLAVGYPDPVAPVNAFVPARAALADYTQWFD